MPQLGYISGSRFSDMMTTGRGKAEWGKTSENLAIRVAAERLGIVSEWDQFSTPHMENGNEQEPFAIEAYERETFREVHSYQKWQQHPEFEFVGVTPDGLVGDIGLIESKSPKTENHLLNLMNAEQVGMYKYQIQGSLWVTGREWCDFLSFDYRVADKYQLWIHRVERDEKIIKQMEERYLQFEEKVTEIIAKLEAL